MLMGGIEVERGGGSWRAECLAKRGIILRDREKALSKLVSTGVSVTTNTENVFQYYGIAVSCNGGL